MRPDPRPVTFTIHPPSLPDEAVVEINDFLFEILELFETHYALQIQRFIDDHSYDNIVHTTLTSRLTIRPSDRFTQSRHAPPTSSPAGVSISTAPNRNHQ